MAVKSAAVGILETVDVQPISPDAARLRLYGVALAAHALAAALLPFSDVRIDCLSFLPVYFLISLLMLANATAGLLGASRVTVTLDAVVAGALAITPVTLATYLAIGVGMPLADQRLAAWDRALGFDWRAFMAFVDERPQLSAALSLAYRSFLLQLFLVPIWLAASGAGARAFTAVAAFVLLCFASSFVSIWFPALGAYVTYGVGPGAFAHIDTRVGFVFLETFNAARETSDFVLTSGTASGILTFPSVHVGVAVICAWAAWRSLVLRVPILLLNVAMTAGAVSHGSHYFVDLIGGAAMAACSIVAARALFHTRRPSAAPAPALQLAGRAAG